MASGKYVILSFSSSADERLGDLFFR